MTERSDHMQTPPVSVRTYVFALTGGIVGLPLGLLIGCAAFWGMR